MRAYLDDPDTPILKGGKVAVVGGGNVAMDAARTALQARSGEGIYCIPPLYGRASRRAVRRWSTRKKRESSSVLLNNPVEILGYRQPGRPPRPEATAASPGIKCIKMELGEPDERGRRRPVPIEGSEFALDVDTVIMAIGTSPNPLIKTTTEGLDVNKRGGIIVEEGTGATTSEGVYAGGDAVTGAATVISAMGAGKVAAKAIDEYIQSK